MNKQASAQRLFITSAFTTPSSRGYVYVEADKEIHVKEAIRGIRALKHWKIRIVPLKEMVQAITVAKSAQTLREGDWVRVRLGLYKGDLASVVYVNDQSGEVTVKLIPRLDLTAIKTAVDQEAKEEEEESDNEDGGEKKKGKKRGRGFQKKQPGGQSRPLPRLLDVAEIRSIDPKHLERKEDIERKGEHFDVYRGQQYRNGYLFKKLNQSGLITEDVYPSLVRTLSLSLSLSHLSLSICLSLSLYHLRIYLSVDLSVIQNISRLNVLMTDRMRLSDFKPSCAAPKTTRTMSATMKMRCIRPNS